MSVSSRRRRLRRLTTLALSSLSHVLLGCGEPNEATRSTQGLETVVVRAEIPSPDDWQRLLGLEATAESWSILDRSGIAGLSPSQVQLPFVLELPLRHCLAFRVGTRVLVTAAHCLPHGSPLNPLRIDFVDSGGVHLELDATCVHQPGSWSGASCESNGTHDRSLCYLPHGEKLDPKTSVLPIADPQTVGPVDFSYVGPTDQGWVHHDATHTALDSPCHATQTTGCTTWSGTPGFFVRPTSGDFAGLGLLSVGDGCPAGHPTNTAARFSSIVDDGFGQLLDELGSAAGLTAPPAVDTQTIP